MTRTLSQLRQLALRLVVSQAVRLTAASWTLAVKLAAQSAQEYEQGRQSMRS